MELDYGKRFIRTYGEDLTQRLCQRVLLPCAWLLRLLTLLRQALLERVDSISHPLSRSIVQSPPSIPYQPRTPRHGHFPSKIPLEAEREMKGVSGSAGPFIMDYFPRSVPFIAPPWSGRRQSPSHETNSYTPLLLSRPSLKPSFLLPNFHFPSTFPPLRTARAQLSFPPRHSMSSSPSPAHAPPFPLTRGFRLSAQSPYPFHNTTTTPHGSSSTASRADLLAIAASSSLSSSCHPPPPRIQAPSKKLDVEFRPSDASKRVAFSPLSLIACAVKTRLTCRRRPVSTGPGRVISRLRARPTGQTRPSRSLRARSRRVSSSRPLPRR